MTVKTYALSSWQSAGKGDVGLCILFRQLGFSLEEESPEEYGSILCVSNGTTLDWKMQIMLVAQISGLSLTALDLLQDEVLLHPYTENALLSLLASSLLDLVFWGNKSYSSLTCVKSLYRYS